MKKTLILTAVAMVLASPAAFAEKGGKGGGSRGDSHGGGKMFEKHDTNGDGMISKEEFMAAHEARFTEMDTNGDGNLSKEELKAKADQWRDKMKERRDERKERRGQTEDSAE